MARPWIKFGVPSACVLLILVLIAGGVFASTPLPKRYDLPPNGEVVTFLTQSIDWYRNMAVQRQIETDPVDLLFLDENQPIAIQIVRLSFDFAKADAALAPASGEQKGAASPDFLSSDLAHFLDLKKKTEEAGTQASQDVETLKQKLLTARGSERKKLQAALNEAQSRLELFQFGSERMEELVDFVQASGTSNPQGGNFESTIDTLARTVPEATNPANVSAELPKQTSNLSIPKALDPGILGMASGVAALRNKLRILDEEIRLTDNLMLSSTHLRSPFERYINQILQSGIFEASKLQASDLGAVNQQKASLDALTVQVKDLAPVIAALDKQKALLTVYGSHLGSWRSAVVSQYQKAWKTLILRLILLGFVIALLASIAAVLRRVTTRHVHEANRRRMLLVVQGIVIWFAIILIAAFAFATDLSSLATFLGLITAGVAVALQNVILAVLGYFLLVGKLGIRVGDRVQISNVTGDIIDIGLLQFQLQEVDKDSQQLTGHVATFSNSFVFVSPATGLFKFNPVNSNTDTSPAKQPEEARAASRALS